jgi:hypothetical protein
MVRMLLISGESLRSETTLRRRILRFTGSRRATRAILRRIDAARGLGGVVSLLVRPTLGAGESDYGDELGWDVSVSYAGGLPAGGL